MKDKIVAIVLAFFLGGFGAHRFYVRQTGLGIAYLLFFWTFIPVIISIIDIIVWLTWSEEKWNAKYNIPDTSVKPNLYNYPTANVTPNVSVDSETAQAIKQGRATHFYPSLAGFQYHEAPKLTEHFKPGVLLKLVREPENQYHDKAIMVMYGDSKLGYLPRQYANSFAGQIERGDVIEARIFNYVPQLHDDDKLALELIDVNFFNKAKRVIKAH